MIQAWRITLIPILLQLTYSDAYMVYWYRNVLILVQHSKEHTCTLILIKSFWVIKCFIQNELVDRLNFNTKITSFDKFFLISLITLLHYYSVIQNILLSQCCLLFLRIMILSTTNRLYIGYKTPYTSNHYRYLKTNLYEIWTKKLRQSYCVQFKLTHCSHVQETWKIRMKKILVVFNKFLRL